MSRAPREPARWVTRNAHWSMVSETIDEHGLTYRVLWSAETWMYLGLCDAYPNLSWQAANQVDALDGIRQQVYSALATQNP